MTFDVPTVCMFAPTPGGGHARYAWELATALARHPQREFRFELVSSTELEPAFREAEYVVHPILPAIRERSTFRTRVGWALNRALHYPVRENRFLRWLAGREDIATVHLQEWKPWLAARLIRRIRAMGKKTFYTVHNVLPHRYPPLISKHLMDYWIRKACLECDGLFVHTEALAHELGRFLGPGHPPVTIVPHGVWTVPDTPGANRPLRERLALKRLLFFGAIRRNKGLHLLLQALPQLPGYEVTVAGDPSERDYFDNEIVPRVMALRAAGARVHLIDRFVSDAEVDALFSSHSAIVLPYTKEFVAQSGVVFMALAHGVPVVSSTAGGLRELLGDYPIGATFETEFCRGLADAVGHLHAASHCEELERQIKAARRRFTWHAAACATLRGYAAVTQSEVLWNDCAFRTTPAH